MPAPGLREQKYQRIRARLIDSAVTLCLEEGYHSATVERIAGTADVSPRTVSRYFTTKDEVFLALLEPMSEVLAEELSAQTAPLTPLAALLTAHVALWTRIADRPFRAPSAEQLATVLRVIASSDDLRRKIVGYRDHRVMSALAHTTGMPTDDRRLDLAMTLFNLAVVTACADLGADVEPDRLGPRDVMQRTQTVLAHVAELIDALEDT